LCDFVKGPAVKLNQSSENQMGFLNSAALAAALAALRPALARRRSAQQQPCSQEPAEILRAAAENSTAPLLSAAFARPAGGAASAFFCGDGDEKAALAPEGFAEVPWVCKDMEGRSFEVPSVSASATDGGGGGEGEEKRAKTAWRSVAEIKRDLVTIHNVHLGSPPAPVGGAESVGLFAPGREEPLDESEDLSVVAERLLLEQEKRVNGGEESKAKNQKSNPLHLFILPPTGPTRAQLMRGPPSLMNARRRVLKFGRDILR
jgi:hypothetical protein